MNFGCHRSQRSDQFKASNYVSHIPKSKLDRSCASDCIQMYESYFNQLVEKNFTKGLALGTKGYIRLTEQHTETRIEISGNSNSGSIRLQSGLSKYAEVHFSPRAIHVYQHEGGNFGQEAAVFLNRRLPTESYSFGSRQDVAKLLSKLTQPSSSGA